MTTFTEKLENLIRGKGLKVCHEECTPAECCVPKYVIALKRLILEEMPSKKIIELSPHPMIVVDSKWTWDDYRSELLKKLEIEE